MAWTAGLLLACVAIAARSRRLRSGCTEQDWNPCEDFEVLREAGDTEAALGSDGPAGNAIRFKAIAQLLLAFNTVATGLGLTLCGRDVGARYALFLRGCSAHAVAAQQGIVETKQALFDATQGPLDRSSNLNLQHDHIHTSAEDHLSPEGMDAIRLCKEWISHHVIRLGLCPFAATPFAKEKIRYSVSDATSSEELLEDFFDEGLLLLEADPEDIATTMLIAPQYPEGIEAFHEMYEWLVELLESGDEPVLENRVQPAFFHPDWNFEELPYESPIHFEKRAPIPVINLLRRADLDAVVKKGLDRGIIINKEIAEHNAASLEAEGIERLSKIFRTRLTREAFPALAHAGPCPHHTQSSTSRDPGRLTGHRQTNVRNVE